MLIVVGKSDIYKLKSIGDNFDPCGTPALTINMFYIQLVSPIWIMKLREYRKDIMILKITVGRGCIKAF